MLEIKNLSVSIHDKPILDGLSLSVNAGEVAAIMGPNGSGKSTLAYVIAGKPDYEVTSGEILLDGENLLELEPNERAQKGVFLAFQYPTEIPGVGDDDLSEGGAERAAAGARRKRPHDARIHAPRTRSVASVENRPGDAAASAQCRLFGGRKEAIRGAADVAARAAPRRARRDRLRARHRRAENRRLAASTPCAIRTGPFSSSPTISGCSTTSSRTSCM